VGKAVFDLIEKRIQAMRDDLVADIRVGNITLNEATAADDLAGYIFRLHRAAVEGCAREKLRLMSAYFFGRESRDQKNGDEFLDAASVIEQLSQEDLKCLAVYKKAIADGWDLLSEGNETGIWQQIDLLGLFENAADFQTAAQALVRFGFVHMVSGWGTLVLFAEPRLIGFLENLSLEDLGEASSVG
jgi:hypothetical protein